MAMEHLLHTQKPPYLHVQYVLFAADAPGRCTLPCASATRLQLTYTLAHASGLSS
jgi:hypothetical protein